MTSTKVVTKGGEVQLVDDEQVAPWTDDTQLAVVGKTVPRKEAYDKVTGRAEYTYDVHLPRQLYAAVLRSPYPHARITRIDTSRAEALPGVYAVISSANTPDISWYTDGKIFDETVRFIGDEVAAVAAVNLDVANDALDLIDVEYEVLPFVTDPLEAVKPGAPAIHDGGNVIEEPDVYDRGDAATALAGADVVIERTYRSQAAIHNALEPHGCTVHWDGDMLTMWSSTQSIFTVRQQVAEALGMPESRVRVIKHHMGGAFGAKQVAWKNDVIAPLLARRAGRPVQLMLDRRAEDLAAGHRNATVQHIRIGAKRDGTLVAIDTDIYVNRGAYQVGGEASMVDGIFKTLYACDNVHTRQTSVYTNLGPAVAFRAPGHVEGAWALEQAMDDVARKLGMDPVELRRKNYTSVDQLTDKPYSLPDGLAYCYDRVTKAFGWDDGDQPEGNGSRRRGFGFAAHDWLAGGGSPPAYATAKLNPDGRIDVITGTQDIGTGTRTGLAQIAAEEFGVDVGMVDLRLGDTAVGPYSPVSSGSSTVASIGPAIRAAVGEVRRQLLDLASAEMEIPADRLTISEGRIRNISGQGKSLAIADVMEKVAPANILGEGGRGPNDPDVSVRTFGAQCLELEVDTETGEVTVLRVASASDIGRIVNPGLVDSQVYGGVTQGVGFGLLEHRVVDPNLGRVLNPNLEDYYIPTMMDIPEIRNIPVDVPDLRANIMGVKGVGEPPLIPTAPAIANAIYDATGVRVHDGPITRQRLLDLLAERTDTDTEERNA